MKVYKRENKNGQRILAMARYTRGYYLHDIYDNPSYDKKCAYDRCVEKYGVTPGHSNFRLCGYNTFSFTAAWDGQYIDKDGVVHYATFVETKDNSYVVI